MSNAEIESSNTFYCMNINDISNKINLDNVSMKLDLFGKPCNSEKIIINEGEKLLNILVIDCGIKNSQLRDLLKYNIQLTVVDTKYNFRT